MTSNFNLIRIFIDYCFGKDINFLLRSNLLKKGIEYEIENYGFEEIKSIRLWNNRSRIILVYNLVEGFISVYGNSILPDVRVKFKLDQNYDDMELLFILGNKFTDDNLLSFSKN